MVLCTRRCLLRPFRAEDLDAFMAYRNDLDWMRYQGWKGLSKAEYAQALLGPQSLADGAQLAIVRKETDALIGDLYLRQEGTLCWIGYTIAPAMARQGYAFEAVSAALRFLAAQGIAEVRAGVEDGNAASAALLNKLGFAPMGQEDGQQIYGRSMEQP